MTTTPTAARPPATPPPTTREQFAALSGRLPPDAYNLEHFRTVHLVRDARRTINRAGPHPGAVAPDFLLPTAEGDALQLAALRGRPVLLHFGSIS